MRRTLAKQYIKELTSLLRAKGYYNPILKVFSGNSRTMWEHYCKIAGDNSQRLQEMADSEKLIISFPRLQMRFLEGIMGYRRLG